MPGSIQHLFKDELVSGMQAIGGGRRRSLDELLPVEERNELIREALARRPIVAFPEAAAAGGSEEHNWKVTTKRWPGADPRLWRVNVGPGCINGEPARMSYLRTGDPRGWTMPADYAPFAALSAIFGPAYPFVDRSMLEVPAPFLLVTTPSADGVDPGGFDPIPPARRPAALRSARDWERDLYRASVWASVTTWKVDPQNDLVRARAGFSQPRRWRVFAGRRPGRGTGVRAGEAHELARLWLLRKPGVPSADRLLVEQRTCWSLGALAVEPTLGLPVDVAGLAAETLALGFLGLGALGSLGIGGLVAIEAITAILLAELSDTLESAGSTPFWSR